MGRRRQLEPYTDEARDPLEQLARMLAPSSYRVPVEGRGSKGGTTPADVSAAAGLIRSGLERDAAVAVATRAEPSEIARLALRAYRRVLHHVREMRPRVVELSEPADRWRVRMVIYDAAHDLVWPEQRESLAKASKATKMRIGNYAALYKVASWVLQGALADGRSTFAHRLFGRGD